MKKYPENRAKGGNIPLLDIVAEEPPNQTVIRIDSESSETKLHQAVKGKQIDKVNQILRSSNPEDVRKSIKGYFLLHLAAKDKKSDILNALLEFTDGEMISQKNKEGKTPLHFSVESKSLQCFKLLVQKSVKTLSMKDKSGNTPVHYLAKNSFVEACEIAVQFGSASHWNIINNKHEMPVHIAAMENSYQVLEMLLNNGARPDLKSRENRTPLHYACDNGYNKCVRIIVRSITDEDRKLEIMNATTKSKSTPLIMAAAKGFRLCCLEIKEADPNLQDNNGQTALHYAARKGYLSVVKHLLDVNVKLDIKDKNKHSALYHAACGSNEEVLDLLLDEAGTADEPTVRTILRVACKKNYETGLKVLIKKHNVSALINDAPEGDSLLHMSIKKGNYKITKLLLDEGADKDICNSNKEYPLHLVAEQGKLPSRVDEHERLEVCKMILQNSHHLIHEVNNKNETPLHLAAKSGNLEMIHSLLSKGGKIMVKDSENRTVVHVAAESGHQSGLKAILKEVNGARQKEISELEPHPLHLAAENGHLECCKLIIKHMKMRHLAVENADGLFPVDSAYKAKKFDTFRYLLNDMNVDHKLKSFCCRLHEYCEKSILENRPVVFEVVINSPWFIVAFDGLYCANLNEPTYGLKPCQSFARLSKTYPEVACQLMDKFITKPSNESVKEFHNYTPFEFIYYFEKDQGIFESPFDTVSPYKLKPDCRELDDVMWGRDHPLVEASSIEDHRVLTHKLTKSWLRYKFNKYIRKILSCYIFMDFLTTIFITTFVTLLWNTHHLRDNHNTSYEAICTGFETMHIQSNASYIIDKNTNDGFSNCSKYCKTSNIENCKSFGLSSNCLPCSRCVGFLLSLNNRIIKWMQFVCWLFFAFHAVVEFWLFRIHRKRGNLKNAISPMRQLRLIFSFVIFLPLSACDYELGMRNDIQWQIGVYAVLVSWFCLISSINRTPNFNILMPFNRRFYGIYLKLIFMIGLVLLTFAVCFRLLLSHSSAFYGAYYSPFIKTLVWLLGDLGYDDTFLSEENQLDYPIQSNLIFLIFILGIGSLIFNLISRDSSNVSESYSQNSAFYRASNIIYFYLLLDDCFPSLRKKYAIVKRDMISSSNSFLNYFGPKKHKATSITLEEENNEKIPLENEKIYELMENMLEKMNYQNKKIQDITARLDLLDVR